MPDIYVYSTDPGREVRTSKGAVINAIAGAEQTPEADIGVAVLGVIGTPANDRGAADNAVRLSGTQEIFSRWGGFLPHVGDGSEAGYNGNVAALLYKLLARDVVFCPVNMEARLSAEVLRLKFARTFSITGEADTETITTDRPHGLTEGDEVTFTGVTGGAGATWTGTHTVLLVQSPTDFTLTGVTYTTDVTAGTMTAAKRPAFTLPAGTIVQTASDGFRVRTLEDVSWPADDSSEREVRFAKVSGTEAAINTIDEFASTVTQARVTTTSTDEPDEMTPAEIALRYQAAMDAFNVTLAGQSANVMIADRTEAAIADALTSHCAASTSDGIFRVAVVSPPVGTTVEEAQADDNDGVRRSTLNGEFGIYVHPGWRRRFPLDGTLSAADDYKATFPAHALYAAKMLTVRPEENPSQVDAEPGVTYGAAELEMVLTREQKVEHFKAGIVTSVFERLRGRRVPAWRDGIMASGEKIGRKRLRDFITENLIARATPYHKRLASTANQTGIFNACNTWLLSLRSPQDERIRSHELTVSYDGETEELTLQADVVELGSMDIITIRVGVTASGFTILTEE